MSKKEMDISEALKKVAMGFQVAEVTEEFAEVDGEMKLTKRKRTKKDVPPDLKAVQLLLESRQEQGYRAWSDEDLEKEKQRLLKELEKGGRCEANAGELESAEQGVPSGGGKAVAAEKGAKEKKAVKKTASRKKSVVKKTANKKTVVKK